MRFPTPRVAAVLIVVGAVLRVATLDYHSLWLDETFDIWAATTHTAEQIWTTQVDPNEPSLYFWLLHHVLAWLGVSEVTARLPSAVASLVGIGLVYALGRTLAPQTPLGRTAAVLLALAPIDFWYAQEARMHGLVAPAGALLALGLVTNRWWSSVLVASALAFGLSIDHTMWPVAIVIFSAWLVWWAHQRDASSGIRQDQSWEPASFDAAQDKLAGSCSKLANRLRQGYGESAEALAAAEASFHNRIRSPVPDRPPIAERQAPAERQSPSAKRVIRAVVGTALGLWIYSPTWPQAIDVYSRLNTVTVFINVRRALGIDNLTLVSLPAAILGMLLVCTVLCWVGWRFARVESRRARIEMVLLGSFLVATVLTVVPRAFGFKQILVGLWPLVTVAGAWSVVSIEGRRASRSSKEPVAWHLQPAVGAVVISLCALLATFATPRADWRGVAAFLAANSNAGPRLARVVVLDPPWNDLPFSYYAPGYPIVRGSVASAADLQSVSPNVREACLVAQRFGLKPPTSPSEAWLDRNLDIVSTRAFARLEVRCYRVAPQL